VLDDLSKGRRRTSPRGPSSSWGRALPPRRGAGPRRRRRRLPEAARVSVRSSVKQFFEDADTNFMGTLNLLRCSAAGKVRKIVFASSMAVYADSPKPEPISEEHPGSPSRLWDRQARVGDVLACRSPRTRESTVTCCGTSTPTVRANLHPLRRGDHDLRSPPPAEGGVP